MGLDINCGKHTPARHVVTCRLEHRPAMHEKRRAELRYKGVKQSRVCEVGEDDDGTLMMSGFRVDIAT